MWTSICKYLDLKGGVLGEPAPAAVVPPFKIQMFLAKRDLYKRLEKQFFSRGRDAIDFLYGENAGATLILAKRDLYKKA